MTTGDGDALMANDYEDIVQLIKRSTHELDGEAKVLCVMGAVASVVDDVAGTSFGPANTAGQWIFKKLRGKQDRNEVPNPWFVFNGHEDSDSPMTKKYLKSRGYKSKGATAISVAGGCRHPVCLAAHIDRDCGRRGRREADHDEPLLRDCREHPLARLPGTENLGRLEPRHRRGHRSCLEDLLGNFPAPRRYAYLRPVRHCGAGLGAVRLARARRQAPLDLTHLL